VLSGFLEALGALGPVPGGLDARAGLYRSMLAGRRMLVVLDNARDEAQVRSLLPGSPGCLVLVTSRNQLAGLAATDGAKLLGLEVLGEDDAAELLAARLGPGRAAAEPAAAAELIRLCGRLPLALAIVAARAAARPAYPLAALAGELREAGGRLDALDAGEPAASTRAVLSWSCRHLSAPGVRLLRLLGVHPGPDIGTAAAASTVGTCPRQVHAALGELTSASLLAEHAPGRYLLHDLVRLYATELACVAGDHDDQQAATNRMLDHYLHTANRLLAGSWRALDLGAPEQGVTPEECGGDAGLAWFDAEYKVMLRLAGRGAANEPDARAWQLPWTMTEFLDRRGYWDDWAGAQRAALEAACRLGDRAGQARASHSLGQACIQLCRYSEGLAHLRRAQDLYEQLQDRDGQIHVHLCRCAAADRQHRHRDALAIALRAMELLGPAGRPGLRAMALNNLGYCYALTGDYQQALTLCAQARDLHRELGAPYGEADAWDSMAYAHQHLGHHSQAIDCYQRARHLNTGNHYKYGRTTDRLGDAYQAAGDTTAARSAWQQALATYTNLHHPNAAQTREKLESLNRENGVPGFLSNLG
jgi:tetratricopeptide (TPR) repeat protein